MLMPTCSFVNVRKARQGSGLSFQQMFSQHIPYTSYLLLIAMWIFSPYSNVLSNPGTNEIHIGKLTEFSILATCSFGLLGPRIILARLTRSPFPGYNLRAFLPLLLGAVAANLPFLAPKWVFRHTSCLALYLPLNDSFAVTIQEKYVLHCATIASTATFLLWFTQLCQGFMKALDIGCFSIKGRIVSDK
jgi:ethanolaminephosphotransferase